jgi:hypothetical protein
MVTASIPAQKAKSSYEALVSSHQLAAAESGPRDFLSREPRSAPAHFLLGYVLYREKKPEASLAEYTEGAKFRANLLRPTLQLLRWTTFFFATIPMPISG